MYLLISEYSNIYEVDFHPSLLCIFLNSERLQYIPLIGCRLQSRMSSDSRIDSIGWARNMKLFRQSCSFRIDVVPGEGTILERV